MTSTLWHLGLPKRSFPFMFADMSDFLHLSYSGYRKYWKWSAWICIYICTFYGTWKLITTFTNACNLSLSWASSIKSIPLHPTSWRSILILSAHLRLGLSSGLFPSGFPTRTLYMRIISTMRAACPAHPSLLDLITWTIFAEEYRPLSSSLRSFHSLVTSSLLGPNILNTLFSNTLSLRSSLNVSDQVSHSYTTTGKIIVLYVLIFKFLDSRLEDKIFYTKW